MASPVVLPRIRFFTATGEPLAGGLLHSYVAGTTTPLAAYTDPAGVVPHTNPIVLDSAGEAEVWLGDASAYKFVLQDAEGVVQWTADQISSISRLVTAANDLLRTDLADQTDADKGAGLSGLGLNLEYEPGSMGFWVTRGLTDFNVFRWIAPSEWQAILDGTSTYDASPAWTSAINAAVALGRPARVTCPTGRYHMATPLGYFTGNDITVDLAGATLDFADADVGVAGALIGFQGTYDATAVLTSNAAQNGQTLACVSTAFAVGDMVRIYSTTVWDSLRTSARYGELNFIETIPDAASVTVVAEIETAYTTAATATIQKVTPVRNVHVVNGTLIGPVANDLLIGVDFKLGLGCSVRFLNAQYVDVIHVRMLDCSQSDVIGCQLDFASNATQAYGVSMTDASQDCTVQGNTMRNVRHGFTTNNNVSTSYGITRRITVAGNKVYNNVPNYLGTSGDALDSHAGSESIRFINNTIKGAYGIGINAEGRNTEVRNNKIQGATAQGIRVVQYPDVSGTVDVTDNNVTLVGDSSGSQDYGVLITTVGSEIQGGCISGNTIRSKNEALVVRGTSSFKIRRVSITGNSGFLRDEGLSGASLVAAEVSYCEYSAVGSNQFTGRTVGLLLENVTHIPACGNQIVIDGSSGANGYGIRLQGTNDYVASTGNTLAYAGTGIVATVGISYGGTTTNSGAWCNVTEGFTTPINVGGGAGCVAANNI